MSRLSPLVSLFALIFAFSSMTFAATEYVVVNINSVSENAGKIYALDSETGTLRLMGVLATGGAGLRAINFGDVEQATRRTPTVYLLRIQAQVISLPFRRQLVIARSVTTPM